MLTSYYYYDSSLGGARDALVVVQLSRSGSSVDKRRSSTSQKTRYSRHLLPPGSWRGSWRVYEGSWRLSIILDHLRSSWTYVNFLLR